MTFQCFFDAFLNCLNSSFDLFITFGVARTRGGMFKIPLFGESFEYICCNSGPFSEMTTLGIPYLGKGCFSCITTLEESLSGN